VLLVDSQDAPAILAVVIIGREIAIGALREWLAERASVVHVSKMGKWKTAAQLCAIESLLFYEPIGGVSMQEVGVILLWFASVLTLWSGYDYLRASWSELRASQE
ncbi:MAG: CDP-diacylglycerol--glycerol-3-phosphate 3-phosphatidyltransferase, partial [Mariprofundaceae bacterium]|nr:CDP-diacylglycerol--glycerol-3-phosphate 3-phosphatidyltransferase [Mariprofundaceae bacterium]